MYFTISQCVGNSPQVKIHIRRFKRFNEQMLTKKVEKKNNLSLDIEKKTFDKNRQAPHVVVKINDLFYIISEH
jgi:hypothetical protein